MLTSCFKILNKIILFLWKRKMVSRIFKRTLKGVIWPPSALPSWLKATTS